MRIGVQSYLFRAGNISPFDLVGDGNMGINLVVIYGREHLFSFFLSFFLFWMYVILHDIRVKYRYN